MPQSPGTIVKFWGIFSWRGYKMWVQKMPSSYLEGVFLRCLAHLNFYLRLISKTPPKAPIRHIVSVQS